MITGISIENFKGIGERIDLELKPITLLFGPNSAGKSSILHALHYAREVFERHNLDADRTVAGGSFVDLGGFGTFVHDKECARIVRIGIKVNCEGKDQEFFEPLYGLEGFLQVDRWCAGIPDSFASFGTAEVVVSIAWSDDLKGPYVSSYQVIGDGESFAVINSDPRGRRVVLSLNTTHHRLSTLRDWAQEPDTEGVVAVDEIFEDPGRSCLAECLTVFNDIFHTTDDGNLFLEFQPDAFPRLSDRLPFVLRDRQMLDESEHFSNATEAWRFAKDVNEGIARLIRIPHAIALEALSMFRYLGPLRETPPRNFSPPRFYDPSRWASGLGAWDALQHGPDQLVEIVGDWLGSEDKLNAGYHIGRRTFKEIDMSDPLMIKLETGSAFDEVDEGTRMNLADVPAQSRLVIAPRGSMLELCPHDVGIGISQVIPVVVTALDDEKRVLAIEQPELHLHPRLQAELADLFIEAALGHRRQLVLLETHSELIALRLMRRIREAAEGKRPVHLPDVRAEDVAIDYVESFEGATVITPLKLGKQGQWLDPWPDGFFEEGFRERFSE